MNATSLPAATYSSTSTARQRAAAVIAAWLAWRARKVKLEQAVEVMAFATLILAWIVGYCVLCPIMATASHHRAHRLAPAAATFVVLR